MTVSTVSPTRVFNTETPLGIVGLGVMGTGIAGCLRRAGFPLFVDQRNPDRAQVMVDQGARALPLQYIGRSARVILLSLPDTTAVEAVLFGSNGLVSTLVPGSVVVDTSTIAAEGARRFAGLLQPHGVAFLDAPVSGGKQAAEQGTLVCMVGGDRQAYDACAPIFAAFATKAVLVGGAGAGQVTKACNQVAVAGALMGVAEALALASKQGVDVALVREVLLGGAAQSFSLDKHGPRIIDRAFEPGFRAVLMRKDLRLALDNGRDGEVYMPVTAIAAQLLDVLCNSDRGQLDWSALGGLVSELSGVRPTEA